jgi:hypothetical protein
LAATAVWPLFSRVPPQQLEKSVVSTADGYEGVFGQEPAAVLRLAKSVKSATGKGTDFHGNEMLRKFGQLSSRPGVSPHQATSSRPMTACPKFPGQPGAAKRFHSSVPLYLSQQDGYLNLSIANIG